MLNNVGFVCLVKNIKIWNWNKFFLLYQRMTHLNFDSE